MVLVYFGKIAIVLPRRQRIYRSRYVGAVALAHIKRLSGGSCRPL